MIQSSGRTLAFKAMPDGFRGQSPRTDGDVASVGLFSRPAHRRADHRSGALARNILFYCLCRVWSGAAIMMMTGRAATAPNRRAAGDRLPRRAVAFRLDGSRDAVARSESRPGRRHAAANSCLAAVFLAALWLFLGHEKRVPSPLINLSIFSSQSFRLRLGGTACSATSIKVLRPSSRHSTCKRCSKYRRHSSGRSFSCRRC